MSWTRLGKFFVPEGKRSWARSHAALPLPVQIGADIFRVFFSTRDETNRSHVGWVDIDLSGAPCVIGEAAEPVLVPGEDGTFDDSGIGIGSLVQLRDEVRLYYMGWNLGRRSPWHNAIGMARAPTVLEPFERFSPGPLLDRSPEDPFTISYPWVLQVGPQDWRMWYGSNLIADCSSTGTKHAIKSARSHDGISWARDGLPVMGFATGDEYAMARPTVVKIGDRFLMCFACRGDRYRIGAARSDDGVSWTRIDAKAGIACAGEGWDGEMVCYPALFRHRDRLWLAYNGNSFGATGFGLAVWEGDYPL